MFVLLRKSTESGHIGLLRVDILEGIIRKTPWAILYLFAFFNGRLNEGTFLSSPRGQLMFANSCWQCPAIKVDKFVGLLTQMTSRHKIHLILSVTGPLHHEFSREVLRVFFFNFNRLLLGLQISFHLNYTYKCTRIVYMFGFTKLRNLKALITRHDKATSKENQRISYRGLNCQLRGITLISRWSGTIEVSPAINGTTVSGAASGRCHWVMPGQAS